jgi:hypothetical protein
MFVLLGTQTEITFGINILGSYGKSFHRTWMKTALQNLDFPSIKILQKYLLEMGSGEMRGKEVDENSNSRKVRRN